jgi:glucose/arabinose dehydrogenase
LLGLAFHPKYATNGRFYVDYTDRAGDTRIVEFTRRTRNRARSTGRLLLKIDQPYANHNGGQIAFGPDGLLYIGMGDGGSGGDPQNRAQDLDSLLGKILRIDVDRRGGGLQYGIPDDNPFRGEGRGEIYAYGLRNPWRFSFDRDRGDLWIGDVGQNEIEEIDYSPKGGARGDNFGWNAFEGRSRYGGELRPGSSHHGPIAQYRHGSGCSVTGGYVYRGTRVPALRGRYVFADYCTGRVWSMRAGPNPGGLRQDTRRIGVSVGNVTSFGEGNDGTLYLIGQAGGTIYRFVAG